MNARMKDALDETLILSDKYGLRGFLRSTRTHPCLPQRVVQGLVDVIVGDIGALYKASEAVCFHFVLTDPLTNGPRSLFWTCSGPSPMCR